MSENTTLVLFAYVIKAFGAGGFRTTLARECRDLFVRAPKP